MTGFFAVVPPARQLLAALFDANVVSESAARFAAFVPTATHLLVAPSITVELPVFGHLFASGGSRCGICDARFLGDEEKMERDFRSKTLF